jgi:transaldolase
MTLPDPIVFLVDVDNTLVDNDRIQNDLKRHLEREFGAACRDRYWAILEELFAELGYRDYLGALQRYRVEHPRDAHLLSMSSYLVDYPFANRLYPGSLDVLERFRSWGQTVILSDGDVVFQPRKVERSGIFEAVEGNVLIYIHKEEALDDVEQRYPAERYVVVDDKLRILTAIKRAWKSRVTTVFVRQGQYAHDLKIIAECPPADLTVEHIGVLLDYDLSALLANRLSGSNLSGGNKMKATQLLHNLGQSLWLDNITRDLLNRGTLKRYIDELSVTGLTSNPTIFDHAIKNSSAYDAAIRKKLDEGKSGEELFFELALEDLTRAADLFRPIYERTNGVDGWVSLEVSPLLAHDTASTLAAAKSLHARAGRPNLLIKIPGTKECLPAIEEAIFAGVPVNVTLLFSREHYVAAADAFLRGTERRIDAGLKPEVGSVASVFISRWDAAVGGKVPAPLKNKLGIAIAKRTYKAYRDLLGSPRWQRIYNAGARPQRLLWASTGTKDPKASDVLYIKALAAPFTVNTMPEGTLKALADHGEINEIMSAGGGECETILDQFAAAGIDVYDVAAKLQEEGAKSFVNSWNELMAVIASKSASLAKAS